MWPKSLHKQTLTMSKSVEKLTAETYAVPAGEERAYHAVIEVVQYDPKTGVKTSRPRLQKFGRKTFEGGVRDRLIGQGYKITILHDPRKWEAEVGAKKAAAKEAARKAEIDKAVAEALAAKEAEEKAKAEAEKKAEEKAAKEAEEKAKKEAEEAAAKEAEAEAEKESKTPKTK